MYEVLAEQRREQAVGSGVFLSTVHSAKGMEFNHVFVPSGGWTQGKNQQAQEKERRVYYVAMTRAKETLCLFEWADTLNPHACLLEGDFMLRRDPPVIDPPDDLVLRRRYDVLGMEDMFLDFAGRKRAGDTVHDHLVGGWPELLTAHVDTAIRAGELDLGESAKQMSFTMLMEKSWQQEMLTAGVE